MLGTLAGWAPLAPGERCNYDDLIDIARHQAALGAYDDLAALAVQAVTMLPGTLATVAYLARATGDLATARTHHQQRLAIAERLAATDSANAQWQKDLQVAQQRIADLRDGTAG